MIVLKEKDRKYVTLLFDDIVDDIDIDEEENGENGDTQSLFTRNIMEGYRARPWRGLMKLIAFAPIFLAGYILVKCIRMFDKKT
ncbi:hypothetical protein IJ098_00675 [Candidatus Saccharibacteria bacterium]|nr:hypothetical protein [Candidatus Saccharibacteria bacterium]